MAIARASVSLRRKVICSITATAPRFRTQIGASCK